MAKSWIDIRKKLESQKRQARILVAAVREGQNLDRRGDGPRKGPDNPRRREFGSQDVECFYCHKRGAFAKKLSKKASG